MPKNIFTTILKPTSVAVVGASREPSKVGHQVLKNILEADFKGKLYPVNPNARSILNLKVYPTLLDLPKRPDLAILVTPAPLIESLLIEANHLKIPSAIIISAGFAESGPKGATLQAHLKDTLKTLSTRVIGPNCLGCFSTINHLNATFGPTLPQKGNIMLISQSGALVTGILDWANAHSLGLSHAVTLGNRLDISEIEALEFAARDRHTQLIMIYLESFANAPKFFKLAAKVSLKKPVVLLKGGQSSLGQQASASHTAALATNYVLVKAWCAQSGVMLADTVESWLTLSSVLHSLPTITSNQVAIITNAGGPGVLTTDEAVEHQLTVPPLSKSTRRELQKQLPRILPHNPLDLLGDAQPEDFFKATQIVLHDDYFESLILIMTPQTTTKPLHTAKLLITLIKKSSKAVIVILLGGKVLVKAKQLFEAAQIPVLTYPTEAIHALSHSYALTAYRHRHHKSPSPKVHVLNSQEARRLSKLVAPPLNLRNSLKLLTSVGLKVPAYVIVSQISDIPAAMAKVERPAVMKTANLKLVHKAKVGGVYLDIMSNLQARLAYRRLTRLSSQVVVQKTIHSSVDLIIGAKKDAQLGTFITFGMGGSLTDALSDRVYAFIPTTRQYLKSLLCQTKAYNLISAKSVALNPILNAIEAVILLMQSFPQIQEMEINPLMVTRKEAYTADIKITLAT